MPTLVLFTVFAVLLLRPGAPATAQESTLHVLPSYHTPAVTLSLRLDKYTVAIGDVFACHFQSSQDGYVTLWDIGSSGRVTRLYPNREQPDGRVQAGQMHTIGGPASTMVLQATAPPGTEDLYAVWTRTLHGQLTAETYASIAAFQQALQHLEQVPATDRATAKVTLHIVSPASLPAVATTGRLHTGFRTAYILALGANVGELTRANSDAHYFAATMTHFLRLPAEHVRVVENARVQDFAAGMAWLRVQAGPQDLALVYFSGHGTQITDNNQDEDDGWDEAFVMYDAQEHPTMLGGALIPLAEHMVRDDQFALWLQALLTRQVLVFLDACFSGGLHRSIDTTITGARSKFLPSGILGQPAPPSARVQPATAFGGGLDALTPQSGQAPALVLMAAAQEGQKALELYHGSLFTLTFLHTLQQARGQSLPHLFATVRQHVDRQSKRQQTPALLGDTAIAATFRVQ